MSTASEEAKAENSEQRERLGRIIVSLIAFVMILVGAAIYTWTRIPGPFNWWEFGIATVVAIGLAICLLLPGYLIELGLLRWSTWSEREQYASAQVVAVVSGVSAFVQIFINSAWSPFVFVVSVYLWGAAITAGMHRHRNRIREYRPSWEKYGTNANYVFSAALIALGLASLAWYQGIFLSRTPAVMLSTLDRFLIPLYLLAPPLAISVITWRIFARRETRFTELLGLIVEGRRHDLPMVSWSQATGTGETRASEDARGRFRIWLFFVAFGAIAGLSTGVLENTILGALARIMHQA